MVLSSFQRQKLLFKFKTFYDVNDDNRLSRQDFGMHLRSISEFARDIGQLKKAERVLTGIFVGLRQAYADKNKNDVVTLDEWYEFWEMFVEQAIDCNGWPPNAEWEKQYAEFFFDLIDRDEDGKINREEYIGTMSNYRVPEDNAKLAFDKLTERGRIPLTKERWMQLWLAFLVSDQPSDAGNFIFGKTAFLPSELAHWNDAVVHVVF